MKILGIILLIVIIATIVRNYAIYKHTKTDESEIEYRYVPYSLDDQISDTGFKLKFSHLFDEFHETNIYKKKIKEGL